MEPFKPANWKSYHERLVILLLKDYRKRISRAVSDIVRNGKLPPHVLASLYQELKLDGVRFSVGKSALSERRSMSHLLAAAISTLSLGHKSRGAPRAQRGYVGGGSLVERSACAVYEQREVLDIKLQMPAPARPKARRKVSPKMSVVARRAAEAKGKLSEWKRKQKLAATKVKAYQKKVNYYNKKGN